MTTFFEAKTPQKLRFSDHLPFQEMKLFLCCRVAPQEIFIELVYFLASFDREHVALHDMRRNGGGDGINECHTASKGEGVGFPVGKL